MIRLPAIPSVPQQSVGAPIMSAQAAGAPAVAMGELAQGIAAASDRLFDHAIKVQRIDNARAISQARQNLAEAYAEHQLELQSDLDPVSRLAKNRQFIASASSFIPADAPPEVIDNLTEHISEWSSRASIAAAEDSAKFAVRQAKATFENEISAARSSLDRGRLQAAVDTAVSGGLMLPEETVPIFTDFDRDQSLATIDAAITEAPDLVANDIETDDFRSRFPGLTEEDIPRVRRAAAAGIQSKRAEEMDLIQQALNEGSLRPSDIEAAQFLTPKDVAAVKKALARTTPPDTSQHAAAWDILFKLRDTAKDPAVSDEDYAAAWNDARTSVLQMLPPGYQGDIAQELSYRSPANRRVEKDVPDHAKLPDSRRTEYRSLISQRIKKAYDDGLLGDIKDDKSKSAKDAYRRFEDARVAISAWIEKNPEADYPAIREAAQKILGVTITDSAPLIRVPALPAASPFDDRVTMRLGMPPGSAPASAALLPPP